MSAGISFKRFSALFAAMLLVSMMLAMMGCGEEKPPVQTQSGATVSDTEVVSEVDMERYRCERYGVTPESLGDPVIVIKTDMETGNKLNISHDTDGTLFADMGDGNIYFYCPDWVTAGDTVKLYTDGEVTEFYCSFNQLTEIDVSGCASLRTLYCNDNNLTKLDVGGNTSLVTLECCNNQLAELNIGSKPDLTELSCSRNKLAGLDVSGCKNLRNLYCSENELTALDLSRNTKLEELQCFKNNIAELDLSSNKALTKVLSDENY